MAYDPYDTQSGTSLAAPFVSGTCALVWSVHPDWPNYKVAYQVMHTADDVEAAGFDIYTGWGRVNAWRAVSETIVDVQKPSDVKLMSANTLVMLHGQVLSTSSGELGGRLYVQTEDRSSGVLLSFGSSVPAGLSEGDKVDVLGQVADVSGERGIVSPVVIKLGTGSSPKPLGLSNRALGGGAFGLQGAVVDRYSLPRKMAAGLNNIGLLVKTAGKVTAVASDWFYIDDGSRLRDDTGNTGVRVSFDPDKIVRPDTGQYVSVTGISSCEFVPNSTTIRRRVLRPRKQDDIRVLR